VRVCSYGDWVNVPGTPKCSQSLTASFSMLENLAQLQALAGVLGGDKATDVTVYGSFLGTMTKAFHGACLGGVGVGAQGGEGGAGCDVHVM
jgi:hypothetical protein